MSGFVHLHCHTTWSLLDGAIPAEALPHLAAEAGYDAIAMTDHDSLLGAVRFVTACNDAGVKPILGAELTIAREDANRRDPHDHGERRSGRTAEDGRALAERVPQPPGERVRPVREDCPSERAPARPQAPIAGRRDADDAYDHVTVIARDARGYANLCRLITAAHLGNERGRPSTTFAELARRAEGLYVMSGCARGEVARLAAAGRIPDAVAAARRWRAAIGDGYRLEVFDHRGYGDRALRDRLLAVARAAGVAPVATNDVHYAGPGDAVAHEVLHAIKDIVPLSRTHALRPNSEYYLKPPNEMRARFDDAPDALAETVRIAESCDVDLGLGRYHFPEVPIPGGEAPASLLARRCRDGAARRFGRVPRAVEDRLEHELAMIFELGFPAYFLLVADIVDHVRNVMGVRCACRGSAAGSLVCYVLGISDVDPVRYDLLFERFMNRRREELPDIDVDVESHRREDVLDYVLRTYGAEQTAVCCMVDTFRARMAIRDVGKALGIAPEEIDVVAKAFPRVAARDIPRAIERLPELRGTNLRAGQLEQLFELCLAIDGFPRHLALHPSGVILSSPDLADRVPMQESFGGFTMLQADKDDVETLGLVKLDVLGVRMLSSITHANDEIARTRGAPVDLDAIPRDDSATYRLMCSSRTLGCFQIESPGQRELLARLQPGCFEDLIVDISLFRPGPVQSDMVGPYLQRRHGFEDVVHAHPSLRPILAETHGIIVFHEQLIRVIAAATGCSLDDADYVRRHLDSERPSLPGDPTGAPARRGLDGARSGVPSDNEVGRWFVSRAVANGHDPAHAAALWREVYAFASFGFCKSHAAAFALPTYVSSWLKAHYPAEFLAGVLTHDPGMYPRRLIVADARHFGVPILPVDVNASAKTYRVEPVVDPRTSGGGPERDPRTSGGGRPSAERVPQPRLRTQSADVREDCLSERRARPPERSPDAERPDAAPGRYGIRLALSDVRDITDAEVDALLTARAERPFESLEDVWRRAQPSRPVLENLVHVGALDSIAGRRGRRELLWKVVELGDGARGATARRARGPGDGQMSFALDAPIDESLPGLPPYSPLEETEAELEVTGIDARRHVMALYEPLLVEIGCTPASWLRARRTNSEVWVAGVKVASQTPAIRSGQRIIFVTLDDLTGPIDVTVFERVQARCARTVFHSWLLLVHGVVRKRGGASRVHDTNPDNVGVTVVVDEAFDLAELAADRSAGMTLARALDRQRRNQAAAALTPSGESGGGSAHDPAAALEPPRSAPVPEREHAHASSALRPRSKLWHSSGGSAGR
ncbi:MAG TPA: DNA polymerase III subunit alpha [Actinomycetota bacterium]|nr:DNA polymerase III subunit alpha [Actinomycetota bacterium]